MVNYDYLYNPDVAKQFFNQTCFSDKKLGFRIIENATIFPTNYGVVDGKRVHLYGGIIDNNGEYVRGTSTNYATVPANINMPPPESIQYISETVVYIGMFFPVWGHIITDNICRIWFLMSEVFKREFKNCRKVYVPEKPFLRYSDKDFSRLLEILGINFNEFQPIMQPTKFDKIILADRSFSGKFTNEYRETIDRIRHFALKNRIPTSSKKIYFFQGAGQIGEEHLAEYFKSKGYDVITGKQRVNNLDEELNLLINAESFASTLGSCAHNSIFLRDGTETILIPRVFNGFASLYQLMANQLFSLNANYVDSTLSIFSSKTSDKAHCYIISKQLKQFFGDKFDGYEEEDFKAFLDYVKSPIRGIRTINLNQMEGYGSVFTDFMEQLKKRENLIKAYDMPLGWETFRPLINYMTHIHSKGWRDGWKGENSPSNPINQQLEVLAIRINRPASFYKIFYSVYFDDEEGWSPEVVAPEIAGTLDNNKPIFGVRIRFDEAGAKEYDILYRMHKFDDTWTDWAKNGEALYSHGVKVNAIQVKLEPKSTITKE